MVRASPRVLPRSLAPSGVLGGGGGGLVPVPPYLAWPARPVGAACRGGGGGPSPGRGGLPLVLLPLTPLTTEALAAHGDSLQHLRRRVAASLSRSACPASSSTAVGGAEEQDELRMRMDLLHEDYYKSVRGEDGEEPLQDLGSPPQTDMGSFYYSGPPTDLADAVSLPRCLRGCAWRPKLPTTNRTPKVCPAYVEDPHLAGPPYGALDRTAELLAKLLSGSEDADVTALSEAVRAKLGITEPLGNLSMAPTSPRLSTLANDPK